MDNKRIKTKIGVGSVVKAKVGEMEDKIRGGIIRRMKKEVTGCVQAVAGKKIPQFNLNIIKRKILFVFRFCMYVQKRRYALIWMNHYLIITKNNKVDC